MKFEITPGIAKKVFWIFFALIMVFMIRSSFDFPTNGDELDHIVNGQANVKFYTSLGRDTTYINPPAPYANDGVRNRYMMHNYGVFTDVTGEVFCGIFTKLGMDFMDARHIWNMLLTMLGVLFTALTARLFTKSWWAATIALAVMIASPFYTGFAYNLSKDTPMATGFIMALYAIYYIFLNFDKPLNKKILLLLAAGIGIAISNRVVGVLLFGYAGLFGMWAVYLHRNTVPKKEIQTKVLYVLGTLVVGFFLAMLFWPYGLVSPINHTIEAFTAFSKFPLKMSTFFDGDNMDINDPYWYFIPKYMLVTSPLIFLAGLALSVGALFVKGIRKSPYLVTFVLLLFPGVFPILYIIYKHSVVYQNWRHVIFVYPTLVVLASLGWYYLINDRKR